MTELIWQGKYDKNGKKTAPVRIALPFQTIETVNEPPQKRNETLAMFAQGRPTEWRNRLIWGDKKYALPSLLPEFAGKVNLIYIDPPFDTGADFSFTAKIPDNPDTPEDESAQFTKKASIIEQKAYRDTWGKGLDSYLQWFYETALLLRELLSENGSIYVHLDWHIGHYAKAVLDEIFGYENFRNEIVVKRPISKNLQAQFEKITALTWGHDSIFWYSKNPSTRFRRIYTKMETKKPEGYWHHFWSNADRPTMRYDLLGVIPKTGQWKWSKDRAFQAVKNYNEYLKFADKKSLVEYWEETGMILEFIRLSKNGTVENWFPPASEKLADTLWIDILSYENTKLYATQKHNDLLERIITTGSNEGDLILDCFIGSGTTAAVAEKLNRRWIACDLGRFAIHTTRKRLLGIPEVKPFVVQNLGKYERQQWVVAEFQDVSERAAIEQRYRHFILQLYHAEAVSGYLWLHGAKAGRMIHVGSVDAPVTIGDVKSIVQEFWKSAGKSEDIEMNGIDILGWEFAFEINETAKQFAAANNIILKFKKIPREVLEKRAVEQGDIKFYELASLSVETQLANQKLIVRLTDFIVPPDDIPEEVRGNITHWQQWVDYWAADWNFQNDTFHNEWQSYRTKKNPNIELETSHVYKEKGRYEVVIKVIDILGNDTTKMIEVNV